MPDDPTPIDAKSVTPAKPAWPAGRRRLVNRWAAFLGAVSPRSTPDRLKLLPLDPWPGNAAAGARLARDVNGWPTFWDAAASEPDIAGESAGGNVANTQRPSIHEFAWLRDLRAIGGDNARACAHTLTRDWLTRFGRYSAKTPNAWRADIMAARLVAWFCQFELLFVPAPDALRNSVLSALVRQHRHLGLTGAREVEGPPRLTALKGLLYGGLCLPDADASADAALDLLETEMAAQLYDDGGNPDRSPVTQLALVRHLTDIRATLKSSGRDVPKFITGALRKATPMVRMLRHADGKLAHFNGGYESDPSRIDLALAQANIRARTPVSAPQFGYERLVVGKYLVLVDTGAPGPHNGHAGAASFEFSFGRERLVVNCGAAQTADPAWRRAGRGTGAHSTLSIGDTNSSEIEDDILTSKVNARIATVTRERDDSDGAIWLTVRHDGYVGPYGRVHHRRLYLSASGEDLRGEDILSPVLSQTERTQPDLTRPGSAHSGSAHTGSTHTGSEHTGRAANESGSDPTFAIRFHLHPTVTASLIRNGEAVLLRLPSGAGWRFRATGAALELTDSIYLSEAPPKRTQQIVLSGPVSDDPTGNAPDITIHWSFRRENAR